MSKRKEATPSWGRSWDGNSCLMGGTQIKVHQSGVVCFHTWGKELCIDPEQVSWARKQKILFSNLTFIPVKNTEYYLCTRQWQTMPSNGNRRRRPRADKSHTHRVELPSQHPSHSMFFLSSPSRLPRSSCTCIPCWCRHVFACAQPVHTARRQAL